MIESKSPIPNVDEMEGKINGMLDKFFKKKQE